MRNKIKKVILAAVISTMVCAPAQGVWAVETDGAELFSDGSDITDSDVTEGVPLEPRSLIRKMQPAV